MSNPTPNSVMSAAERLAWHYDNLPQRSEDVLGDFIKDVWGRRRDFAAEFGEVQPGAGCGLTSGPGAWELDVTFHGSEPQERGI